jgi:hypothetical protein
MQYDVNGVNNVRHTQQRICVFFHYAGLSYCYNTDGCSLQI